MRATACRRSPATARSASYREVICPRPLSPNKFYIACLVPTYDVGVAAGLGQDVAADAAISDAWAQPAPDSIRLPVYFHWEFATGGSGDFKSLVMRLQPHALGAEVGTRKLDITTPGFGVADLPEPTEVDLGGALRVIAPAPPPISPTLAQRLLPVVNATEAVGPPIYGRWHAAASSASIGAIPGWLNTLNLDIRYRVAAGLGTQVVQQRQEDLMAAIWDQLGEIARANQLLRQAQLAIAAARRVVDRHLNKLSPARLLSIAGPALARIRVAPGKTARRAVAETCLPLSALSGGFPPYRPRPRPAGASRRPSRARLALGPHAAAVDRRSGDDPKPSAGGAQCSRPSSSQRRRGRARRIGDAARAPPNHAHASPAGGCEPLAAVR